MRKLLTVAAVVLTWGIASNAAAQRGGGTVDREGFLIGFSIGGGSISCADCTGSKAGPAIDLHIGTMLGEKAAVMLDGSGIGISNDTDFTETVTQTFTIDTVAVQYWVADRVWVKGGAGVATYRATCSGCQYALSDTSLGIMAAAGVELVQKGSFTVDLQGRYLTAKHDYFGLGDKIRFNTFVGMVGFNWY